jgi:hypothetical protein
MVAQSKVRSAKHQRTGNCRITVKTNGGVPFRGWTETSVHYPANSEENFHSYELSLLDR